MALRNRVIRQAEIAEATRAAFLSEGKDYSAVLQEFKDTAQFHATGEDVAAIRKQQEVDENWAAGKAAAKHKGKGKKR